MFLKHRGDYFVSASVSIISDALYTIPSDKMAHEKNNITPFKLYFLCINFLRIYFVVSFV